MSVPAPNDTFMENGSDAECTCSICAKQRHEIEMVWRRRRGETTDGRGGLASEGPRGSRTGGAEEVNDGEAEKSAWWRIKEWRTRPSRSMDRHAR